jgi:hypothetical protein
MSQRVVGLGTGEVIRGLYCLVRLRIGWGRWSWSWNERIVGRGRVEGIIRVVGIGEMAIVVVYAGRIVPRRSTRTVCCRVSHEVQ